MNIREALEIKKYGALTSWRDLFYYQRHCGDPYQAKEIADWARRYNRKEGIILPLKNNTLKLTELPLSTGDIAEDIFR